MKSRALWLIPFAALAAAGPAAQSQANVVENQTTYLYVDAQSGSDSNTGSSSSPLKTIQAAVNKANTNNQKSIGTKIIVNAGIYRETVNIAPVTGQTTAPLTVQAATNGTAIIAASNLLNGWSPDAQYAGAYVANWVPAQSTCALPSGWPSVQPIALHTEMMFVNGMPMTQVLAYNDLKPGTFFVNTADGTVHLWPASGVDPTSATVEVGTRIKTISVVGRSNIVLRGLVLEHAASCINTSGATVTSSNNVLIDSIEAKWNNFGGLGISSSTNVTVQNSIGSYNGGVGFQGTKGQTTLYLNNETDYNNWRGAQAGFYDWAAGGAKFFEMRSTTVRGHKSYNNLAQGLWFDTDNQNITIDSATLVASYNAGLQLERNKGPILFENSHLCYSGSGVNVLTTEGLTANNNVFYANGGTNKFQAQFYLAGTAGGINITDWQTGQVYDLFTTGTSLSGNTFVDAQPGQFVFGTYLSGTDWTDFTSSLTSGNNIWYDPATSTSFRIPNGKNVDLSGWRTATGADYSSTWNSPTTSPDSACAAPAPAYPDFDVSLDSGSYTMSSGRVTGTVRVRSFNFGAVNLSISGLPAGVSASFSAPTLTNGFSTLMLTASSTTSTQKLPVTLWGVSGDRVHSVTFNLTTNANSAVIGTSTSLSASSSSVAENSPVTLTAKVQQSSGTTAPSGTVTFYNGGTMIGTGTLSSGTATLTTSSLPVGTNSVTASYAGDSTFNASASSTVQITVTSTVVSTTTTLASSTSSVTQNSAVTLTASVKQASGTTSPSGSVTFYSGSTSLGSATLTGGVASISTTSLPVGTDTVTATYSGNSTFNSSTSNAVSITVNSGVVGTTTALASSATTINENSAVTLTATVKQTSGTSAPAGTVTFYNGAVSLGSATLSGGVGSITTSALPAGTDSVSAAYSGAVNFNASSSNIVAITVNASPTAVNTVSTLTVSATSITQNSTVTLTASVKQTSGTTIPSGTVTFLNGGSVLGTAQLSAGIASFSTASLPAGSDSITASYAGTTSFNPSSSGAVVINVSSAIVATTTTLSGSATNVVQGSPVTLTATVKQATGTTTPTGSVQFFSGLTLIGTGTLSSGRAAITISALSVGSNAITASYAGNSSFSSSTSAPVTVKVIAALTATSTTLSSSSTSIEQGTTVTLTARVTSASGTAGGTVTIYDGAAVIGTGALAAGTATLATSALSSGTQLVTAQYGGDANHLPSTSNAVTINVRKPATNSAGTKTTISSSVSQADQGYTISLIATVQPVSGSGAPSGSVEFSAGGKLLGTAPLTNGKAYLNTSALPMGDDLVLATYAGDSIFAPSSSTGITVIISGPDFMFMATPSSVSIQPGQSASLQLLITPMNGFNQMPQFSCAGLPPGATCTFGAPTKQTNGTSVVPMTIQMAATAADSHSRTRSGGSLALALLPVIFCFGRKRRQHFQRWLCALPLAALLLFTCGAAIGCGGQGSGTTQAKSASQNATTFNITAKASTGISHTAAVNLEIM